MKHNGCFQATSVDGAQSMIHETKKAAQGKKNSIIPVLLLLAALLTASIAFTGAASAGLSVDFPYNTTVYFYENINGSSGMYVYSTDDTYKLIDLSKMDVFFPSSETWEGVTYTNLSNQYDKIVAKILTADIVMWVHDSNGKKLYQVTGTDRQIPMGSWVSFDLSTNILSRYNDFKNKFNNISLKFISPNPKAGERTYLGSQAFDGHDTVKWGVPFQLDDNLAEGTWSVRAYFIPKDEPGYFAPGVGDAEESHLYSEELEFSISGTTESISVSDTAVKVGEYIAVTITGKPGKIYYLKGDDRYKVEPGQDDYENGAITVGSNGKATFSIKAEKSGTFNLQFYSDAAMIDEIEKEIELTFTKARITASSDKDRYFMGNDIKLSGTNEAEYPLNYYIDGVNLPFTPIEKAYLKDVKGSKNWEVTIKGKYFSDRNHKLDTGGYSIYVVSNTTENREYTDKDEVLNNAKAYTIIPVNLIQPEIRITSASEVVAHGDKLVIKGVAESANRIQYYIFGNNFFDSNTTTTGMNGVFTFDKEIYKDEYAAGQYYVVLQHPMYDKEFNIAPDKTVSGDMVIAQNNTGQATAADTILFSLNERQSANAAAALRDAIDSEDIDDICVTCSFVVTSEETVIYPIQEEVVKGTLFTVSGKSNKLEGDTVLVELLSTKFAAASKYDATSASYSALVAVPDEETGKWSVTFTTDNLNVDEYTVSIKIGTKDTNPRTIRIVEKSAAKQSAPTPTKAPSQPAASTPTNTPAAASPGFGAAAVLLGLGAAYLLKRRL